MWLILMFSVSLAGAALFLWRREKTPPGLRVWAIVSLMVMLLGFLAFMPDVLGAYPGLKQRFFHVGWSLWFIGLNRGFIRWGAGGD